MATNPQSTVSDRTDLTPIRNDRRKQQDQSTTLVRRVILTFLALVALALVLRFTTTSSRTAQARTSRPETLAIPDELRLGSVQMSKAIAGGTLYLDGVVTNTGQDSITGATFEVNFHDAQGKVVASVQKPIAGIGHGGTELVPDEFARNPIRPNEMRFFRVAVVQAPSGWNYQVPDMQVVNVTAK